MESKVAFTDAVARARQIAAKLGNASGAPPAAPTGNGAGFIANPLTGGLCDKGNPNNMPLGTKRSFPGGGDEDISAKKPSHEPDGEAITAQLRAIADQQRPSAKDMAKMAAEQVAAKLNQSIAAGGAGGGAPPMGGVGPHAGLGLVQSEEWAIPNKVVGLVIGSKGENITQIQAQSGCRIQIAPDPPPSQMASERQVSLNGTAESIAKAKDLINRTIAEAGHAMGGGMGPDTMGGAMVEMMIPANKVGLVIGKGGETIKQLQNRSGCKMMMVQDGQFQNAPEKPLKITGDPGLIEAAKNMVKELMDSKDLGGVGGGGGGGGGRHSDFNGYGGGHMETIPVPRDAVGIVIGKGGDMIKKIQGQFSVKIQFQNDGGGPQRMCDISGSMNDVMAAKQHVQELIADNQNRMGMGRGSSGGGFGPGRGFGGPGQDQTSMRVPSDRCGIVIGKGGENIRSICEMSGAHVELNRSAPPGPEKEFHIRGTPEQIQHAMHLINEKVNVPPRGGPGGGGQGGWGAPQGGAPYGAGQGSWGGPPGGPPAGPPGGGGGSYNGGQQQQQQAWGNYNYNQWGQQQGQQGQQQPGAPGTAGTDQQSQDPAWQAYYAQYYSQYQQQQQQGAPGTQPASSAAASGAPGGAASSQAPSSGAAAATTAQPKINPATGEPDYTEAWANYYRQMGYHEQADAILKQAPNGQQAAQ